MPIARRYCSNPITLMMEMRKGDCKLAKRARPLLKAAMLGASCTKQLLTKSLSMLQGVCEVEHVRDL